MLKTIQKHLLFYMLSIAVFFLFYSDTAKSGNIPDSVSGIPTPDGFSRIYLKKGSYSDFLRNLPLKKSGTIKSHSGKNISTDNYSYYYTIDMPLLFKSDIEQCADWAMRLWAEYHKKNGTLKKLYLFNYAGQKKYYTASSLSYKRFLEKTFISTNSHSLKKGCSAVTGSTFEPGDMLIQNDTGGIGHVTVIIDAGENRRGERQYLAGFSFMPAQEFHIEKGSGVRNGWFTRAELISHIEKNYPYGKIAVHRFIYSENWRQ